MANAQHFARIATNRAGVMALEFHSCHSTESHSHKQQGPRGSDGNTNTTYDSIKEVVIKMGEQCAVASRMEFSHGSLGI